MDKYGKALAVVWLVGAEDAVKASEFKCFVNSDAFFLLGRGEKHQKLRFLRILMLFSCGAGTKSIKN